MRAIARQCMLECLGYMLAIANEWDLAVSGFGMRTAVSNGNGKDASEFMIIDHPNLILDSEIAAQRRRQQENLRIMDQIMGI